MLGTMRLGHPENHPSQAPALFEMTTTRPLATSIALLTGLSRATRHLKEQF